MILSAESSSPRLTTSASLSDTIMASSSSSVETTTSTSYFPRSLSAFSTEYMISGRPHISLTFFRGILLEPPRAGITTNIFITNQPVFLLLIYSTILIISCLRHIAKAPKATIETAYLKSQLS